MRNMITDAVIRSISDVVGNDKIMINEPMSRHTTFRIGGIADIVIEPADEKQIAGVRSLLSNMGIPYVILGNGSNVLVGDKGIRGAVIILGNAFSDCVAEGEKIIAKAGIKLSRLANFALENELFGLEFAAGIPGTLGGALYMNAGAYGGEMKQIVESVSYIDENGEIREKYVNDCRFGYRTSIFVQNHIREIKMKSVHIWKIWQKEEQVSSLLIFQVRAVHLKDRRDILRVSLFRMPDLWAIG